MNTRPPPAPARRPLACHVFQTYGELPNWPAYYNAVPTTALPVVRQGKEGRELALMQWGLIPWFSKDGKPTYSTINAHAEGVRTNASYREPFKTRRCLGLRRTLLGIGQVALAESDWANVPAGTEIEKGVNRVSSSRPVDMADALDVTVPYFFQEMSPTVEKQTPAMLLNARALPEIHAEGDPMARRETLELVRAHYRIPDPIVRKRLADLTKAVAKAAE